MTLTKCPRCENHGDPITAEEYAWRAQSAALPLLRAGTRKDAVVCEVCGWKVTR